eukprot:TRINITY_DN24582_c0_g1_i1.p1 TRINITY_DN24582_c0_g1~~TRINITY_DN24582_c0_g1_i1.p1  ORF type:complete len:878 (-),score=213.64 TRINITY_DN24582_c0_g1_i1:161-2740(-)
MALNGEMDPPEVHRMLQRIEATMESMCQTRLSEVSNVLRKDIASREERIMQRVEQEHQERQNQVFELRRDLAMQQSTDLATQEDRLVRRLDGERREQKATIAELRRDVGAQQELRVQVANLRRDLSTTQAALSKLASRPSVGSVFGGDDLRCGDEDRNVAETSAAIADMQRELAQWREQMQLMSSANETQLGNLRKELVHLQNEEMRGLQTQLTRGTSDLAMTVREVQSNAETIASSLRGELRREMERFRSELDVERSHAEQRAGHLGLIEARSHTAMRRVEDVERKIDGSNSTASMATASLEATRGSEPFEEVATRRLLQELETAQRLLREEFATQLSAAESRFQASVSGAVQRALAAEKAADGDRRLAEVAASDSASNLKRRPSGGGIDVASASENGNGIHQLLAEVVPVVFGQLDAELRIQLDKQLSESSQDLRKEIGDKAASFEADLKRLAAEPLSKVEGRLRALEAARLDLRVGALESAAQHSAVFTSSAAAAPLAAAMEEAYGICDMQTQELAAHEDLDISRQITGVRSQMEAQGIDMSEQIHAAIEDSALQAEDRAAQRIHEVEERLGARIEEHLDVRLRQLIEHSQQVVQVRAAEDFEVQGGAQGAGYGGYDAGAHMPYRMASHVPEHVAANDFVATTVSYPSSAPAPVMAPASGGSLISSELKGRLESLVSQVKSALHSAGTHDGQVRSQGGSIQAMPYGQSLSGSMSGRQSFHQLGMSTPSSHYAPSYTPLLTTYADAPQQFTTALEAPAPAVAAPASALLPPGASVKVGQPVLKAIVLGEAHTSDGRPVSPARVRAPSPAMRRPASPTRGMILPHQGVELHYTRGRSPSPVRVLPTTALPQGGYPRHM